MVSFVHPLALAVILIWDVCMFPVKLTGLPGMVLPLPEFAIPEMLSVLFLVQVYVVPAVALRLIVVNWLPEHKDWLAGVGLMIGKALTVILKLVSLLQPFAVALIFIMVV
jgi:hypothetical protein